MAGGWALDLLLGRQTRPHVDIDALILRQDHVHDQAGPVGEVRSAASGPDPRPGIGSRSTQRREFNGTDPVQDPIGSWVRCDRTEQRGLIAQRSQVRQAVATIVEGDSQVGQDPTRQVHRVPLEVPSSAAVHPCVRPDSSASSLSSAAPACDTIPVPSAVTTGRAALVVLFTREVPLLQVILDPQQAQFPLQSRYFRAFTTRVAPTRVKTPD